MVEKIEVHFDIPHFVIITMHLVLVALFGPLTAMVRVDHVVQMAIYHKNQRSASTWDFYLQFMTVSLSIANI